MSKSEREKGLIEKFLTQYNVSYGADYKVTAWPDEVERNKQAVDALAADGPSVLAIEHT